MSTQIEQIRANLAEINTAIQVESHLLAGERTILNCAAVCADYDGLIGALMTAGRLKEGEEPPMSMLGFMLSSEAKTIEEFRAGSKYLQEILESVLEFNLGQSDNPICEEL